MKKKIFLLLFFFIKAFLTCSDASTLDSLQNLLINSHDTVRCRLYLSIAEEFEKQNPDTAIFYYTKSLQLSSQNKPSLWNEKKEYGDIFAANAVCSTAWIEAYYKAKYEASLRHSEQALHVFERLADSKDKNIFMKSMQGISSCYGNIGIVYYLQSTYEKAINYYLKALNTAQKLSISPDKNIATTGKKGMSSFYGNIGVAYKSMGNYVKAVEYYQKALKIKENLGDKKGMCNTYNNIGNVLYDQNNFDNALKYYSKALDIAQEINDKKKMSGCYNNIGLIHAFKNKYKIAIDYYLKSMKIAEELGDAKGKSSCLTNIGNVYYSQGEFERAVVYYSKSLKEDELLGDLQSVALTCNNIAGTNIKMKNYNKAIDFAMKGLKTANEVGAISEQNQSYDVLKASYDSLKLYQQALKYSKLFIKTKDSLFSIEKNKQLTEMETKYQTEKKQLEIDKLGKEKELQNSEMKKQRLIILFVVCGLLAVLGFSFVIFRLFLHKKKANILLAEQKREIEYKNEALNQQNEEIRTQRDEIKVQRDEIESQRDKLGEQNYLLEEQKQDITDSITYAKRIQQAVLPTGEYAVNILGEHFILFKPKDIVSGDFYWATKINDLLIITVADCTGHGVPGAFMSMLGISFLNEIVRKKELTKASEVLDELRTSVIDAMKQKGESGEQKDGMDIALVVINTETLEMQFAGANNPVWIVTQFENLKMNQFGNVKTETGQFPNFQINAFPNLIGSVTELVEVKGDKMPIGIHTNMQPFTNQIYRLQKGDTIYLMSDGYEDQFGGPNRKKFLSKNLKQLLTAICQQRCIEPLPADRQGVEMPMADQKQILEITITDWIGKGEQIDDITILGIKI